METIETFNKRSEINQQTYIFFCANKGSLKKVTLFYANSKKILSQTNL